MKFESLVVLGIMLCVMGVFGCTSDTDNYNVKHFENENISFDYPDTWNVNVKQDLSDYPATEWMIRIENPDEPLATVVISEIETPESINGSSSLKISNVTTKETTDNSTYRMYTFSKNNRNYEIIVYGSTTARWFKEDVFTQYKSHFETIVNSIQMK